MLYALVNWYTKHLRFPFRGWKYARRFLAATGQLNRRFVKKLHNGLFIRVSPAEHIQQQLFWYGYYEKPQVLLWERLLVPGATVLDVGANIGYYTLIASPRIGRGMAYAFEPQASPLAQLRSNIALNNLANVVCVPLGAGDEDGSAELFLAGSSNEGMGSLRQSPELAGGNETIRLVRLDRWCADNKVRPQFVKMDIEGAEYSALLGMTRILNEDRPVLFIEISAELLQRFGRQPDDIYQFLQTFDYEARGISPDSRLEPLADTAEGELVVFIPSEKLSLIKSQL